MKQSIFRTLVLVCAYIVAGSSVSHAADFSIQPISVHLGKGNVTQTLSILNRGNEPVRLQVTGFAWDQDANGETKLAPTDDVIFFPQLVTVPAGERRAIRVGAVGAAAVDREKTYRIFVEELPSLESQLMPHGATVAVRTKMGVPVFIDPPKPAPRGEVNVSGVHDGRVRFTIANHGNAHFLTERINVVGEGGAGAKVFDVAVTGWYVLAGEERAYEVPVAKADCAKSRTIAITVDTDAGELKTSAPVEAGSCA